jgi:hypothetical protein
MTTWLDEKRASQQAKKQTEAQEETAKWADANKQLSITCISFINQYLAPLRGRQLKTGGNFDYTMSDATANIHGTSIIIYGPCRHLATIYHTAQFEGVYSDQDGGYPYDWELVIRQYVTYYDDYQTKSGRVEKDKYHKFSQDAFEDIIDQLLI